MSLRKKLTRSFFSIMMILAMVIIVTPGKEAHAATVGMLTAKYDQNEYCIELKWSEIENGYEYEVYRAKEVDGKAGKFQNQNFFCQGDDMIHRDYEAIPGNTYYYKVVIEKQPGEFEDQGEVVETKVVKCTAKVEKPHYSEISTKLSTGYPHLYWERSEGANAYEIYRATSKNGKYKLIKTVKVRGEGKFTDQTAKAGKTYYYKIKATTTKNPDAASAFTKVMSTKAGKDQKLIKAVKNTTKKKALTLKQSLSVLSKRDIFEMTMWNGGLFYNNVSVTKYFTFPEIKKAGGKVKSGNTGGANEFGSMRSVYIVKNNIKYDGFNVKVNATNVLQVKKNSSEKEIKAAITKLAKQYYPTSKWNIKVEKFSKKKAKEHTRFWSDSFDSRAKNFAYAKYTKNKYVLTITSKKNKNKSGWLFVTPVPTL